MIISRRDASTIATAFALIGVMIVAPLLPPTTCSWLGAAALALSLWPLYVDLKSPTAVAVGHLGLVASCFALGVHDEHRSVWLALLATLAALPLAWAFRRRQRAVKAAAGLVLAILTFVVFAWSTEQLDNNGSLSVLPQWLLFGTGAGIAMAVQALRPAKPPPAPAPPEAASSAQPTLPPWSRDVTS